MCSRSTFWLSLEAMSEDGLAGDESITLDVGVCQFVCLSECYKCSRLNVGSKSMYRRSNGLHMKKMYSTCSYVLCCICAQKEKYLVNHSCFSPSVPLGSRYELLIDCRCGSWQEKGDT